MFWGFQYSTKTIFAFKDANKKQKYNKISVYIFFSCSIHPDFNINMFLHLNFISIMAATHILKKKVCVKEKLRKHQTDEINSFNLS